MSKSKQTVKDDTVAFCKAANKGDVAILKALLAAGQKVDARDGTGKTALMRAAERGQIEAARTLLRAGADPTASVSDRESVWFGCTALFFAAQCGNTELVELLLRAGVPPTCEATDGTTPLSCAVEQRLPSMVKALLTAGAPAAKGSLVTCIWNGTDDVSLLLIGGGANANACDALGQSVLHRAAEKGQIEVVRALIQAKAKLNQKANGSTPLLASVQNGHVGCALELIRAGADVSATALSRRNALMNAAALGQTQIVQALLKAGADPNAKDKEGKTALMLANEKEHAEVVELLRGGSSDECGYKVQEYIRAALNGDLERVRYFLDAGVDVNATYQNGAKALITAIINGHTKVVRLLLERGASVATRSTAKAWGGQFHADALALAAEKGHLEVVRLLITSKSRFGAG